MIPFTVDQFLNVFEQYNAAVFWSSSGIDRIVSDHLRDTSFLDASAEVTGETTAYSFAAGVAEYNASLNATSRGSPPIITPIRFVTYA